MEQKSPLLISAIELLQFKQFLFDGKTTLGVHNENLKISHFVTYIPKILIKNVVTIPCYRALAILAVFFVARQF